MAMYTTAVAAPAPVPAALVFEPESFYQWAPNLVMLLVYVFGGLLYAWWVCYSCDSKETKRVLSSFPAWVILRAYFWMIMGMILPMMACWIDILVFGLIEYFIAFRWRWSTARDFGGWDHFEDDLCGDDSDSSRRDDWCHVSECQFSRDRRDGPQRCDCRERYYQCRMTRRQRQWVLILFLIEVAAVTFGNVVLRWVLITDGMGYIRTPWGQMFWGWAFGIYVVGGVVLTWIIHVTASKCVLRIMMNPHIWILIDTGYFLILGVLAGGAPEWYLLVFLLAVAILEWVFPLRYRSEDCRPWFPRFWDVVLWAVPFYFIGHYLVRRYVMDHLATGIIAQSFHRPGYDWFGFISRDSIITRWF